MKLSLFSFTVTVFILITFVIPFIQLSIGFHYVVKDGENASARCSAATDLPLLMAIGGIFALFSLGISYCFLRMITSKNQQGDMAGRVPHILLGQRKRLSMPIGILLVVLCFRFGQFDFRFDHHDLLHSDPDARLSSLCQQRAI